jgi:hypothetical protein
MVSGEGIGVGTNQSARSDIAKFSTTRMDILEDGAALKALNNQPPMKDSYN